jgi:hypothetical protein
MYEEKMTSVLHRNSTGSNRMLTRVENRTYVIVAEQEVKLKYPYKTSEKSYLKATYFLISVKKVSKLLTPKSSNHNWFSFPFWM